MSTRLKHTPLADEAAFVRTVNSIAALQISAAAIVAQRDAEIVAIQNRYHEQLTPIDNAIDAKLALADAYAQDHRSELLPKDKKSVELATATYGFRTGNRAIRATSKKVTGEEIIENLKEAGLAAYVRTTEEIAKDKILADAKHDEQLRDHCLVNATGETWALGDLALKITQSETFFIEPKVETGETLKGEEGRA